MFYVKAESKSGIDDNKTSGAYAVGTLIGFNIISLILIVFSISFERTNTLKDILYVIVTIIILISVFYSIYFFKKNHKFIFEKYRNESLKKKQIRNIYVTLYIILSVAFLYFAVYIGRENWMIEN